MKISTFTVSPALSFVGTTASTSSGFSEWIISPVFELTGNQRLNFQYKITNTSVNMPKIDVYVLDSSMNYSSMADTSNFVFLASFNTANSNIDEWKMAEVSLNSYVGNVRIALVIREASQSFYVDNFSITTQPTCPDVYDFAVREASQSVLITYNTGNITGDYNVGGLIGYAYTDGGSTISGASGSGTITAKYKVGGLAGWLENVSLNNCTNEGVKVIATEYFTETRRDFYLAIKEIFKEKGKIIVSSFLISSVPDK